MPKAHPERVHPQMAIAALEATRKNGEVDRKAAYSRYMQLRWRATGSLSPGCDNRDLQAFYDEQQAN